MEEQVSGNPTATPELQPAQDTTLAPDPLATLLSEIRDDTGRQKYTDPLVALKALKDSQEHIARQKQAMEQMQEQLNQRQEVQTVQDLLNQQASQTPEPQPATTEPAVQANSQPSLEEQMAAFLAKTKQAEAQEANRNSTKQEIAKRYGERAEEVYSAKAKELGVTPEFLDAMAKTSPQSVLAYFQGQQSPQSITGSSSVNTSAMTPPPTEIKALRQGATGKEVSALWNALREQVLAKSN